MSKSLSCIVLCVLTLCCPSILGADSSEQVSVAVGATFTVSLASNPGTGYSWVLAGSLPNWLEQVDKTFIATNPGLPGGDGTEYWTFRATAAGSATLTFQYQRPWEGTPVQTHVCQVTATSSAGAGNIFVVAGEDFTVALASNPSTGYSWTLAGPLPSWLEKIDQTYVAAKPGLAGGSGTEYWKFRATATGSVALTFQYQRPWESTPIIARVYQVTAILPTDKENLFMAAGEDFTLALAANPSTGYSWTLAGPLPSWLEKVDQTYVATDPGKIGGGGTEYWTLRATAAGNTTLVFQYERPWKGTPIQTHVCQVTVFPRI